MKVSRELPPASRLLWLIVFCLCSCATQSRTQAASRYFSSPQQSVQRINQLLRAEAWSELGEYYDLTGSTLVRQEVQGEEFFKRTQRPINPDPAGF